MDDEEVTYGQKSAHLVLTVNEGAVEIMIERNLHADDEASLCAQITEASKKMLDSVPMDAVKKTSARINESDDDLKEPHPVIVKMVGETKQMVKELSTLNQSVKALCERLGADE